MLCLYIAQMSQASHALFALLGNLLIGPGWDLYMHTLNASAHF